MRNRLTVAMRPERRTRSNKIRGAARRRFTPDPARSLILRSGARPQGGLVNRSTLVLRPATAFSICSGVRGVRNDLRRERQLEGIARAKAEGVYKGRAASIDAGRVRELKPQGLGATEIAKTLNIGRASV